MKLRWSTQNKKNKITGVALDSTVWSFNLPAYEAEDGFRVCPMAGVCKGPCFARGAGFRRAAPRRMYESNLATLRSAMREAKPLQKLVVLLQELLQEVRRKNARVYKPSRRVRHVRLHDSGDFFHPLYLDAWLTVMREHPDLTFYAYTKSVQWVITRAMSGQIPSNFRIAFSEGGTQDHLIGHWPRSRIIVSDSDWVEPHVHLDAVPPGWDTASGNAGDTPLLQGSRLIALPFHLDRPLTTDEQSALLESARENDQRLHQLNQGSEAKMSSADDQDRPSILLLVGVSLERKHRIDETFDVETYHWYKSPGDFPEDVEYVFFDEKLRRRNLQSAAAQEARRRNLPIGRLPAEWGAAKKKLLDEGIVELTHDFQPDDDFFNAPPAPRPQAQTKTAEKEATKVAWTPRSPQVIDATERFQLQEPSRQPPKGSKGESTAYPPWLGEDGQRALETLGHLAQSHGLSFTITPERFECSFGASWGSSPQEHPVGRTEET